MATLDLSALEKALKQLAKYLAYANEQLAEKDLEGFDVARTASIQAFEYSYEICIKMLRRYLRSTADSTNEIDELSFKDMIRESYSKKLVNDPEKWFRFREMRNITSHSYDDEKAASILLKLPEFLFEAKEVLEKLRNRYAS